MKKVLIIIMGLCFVFAFAGCGESDEPTAYEPVDIQVDASDDVPLFMVIYDVDSTDTEQWSGYENKQNEVQTAINGIKACMEMDEWNDNAVVFGYGKEAKLKYTLYTYGSDSDYSHINMHQLGAYNTTYILQGELD